MKWMFLLFAVVFGGVGFGMLFGLVLPEYRDRHISNNGNLRVAVVEDISSNMSVNEVPYYRIHFRYEGKGGVWINGKTNSAYTRFQAEQIKQKGEINIRVSGNRAVADDFKGTPGHGFFWIFVIAFGGVGIGMGTAFVWMLMVSLIAGRVRLRGFDGEGYYIDSRSGIVVNGVPRYKLEFGFKTASGQDFVMKTPSKYSGWQVDALRNMGTFRIKYLGKHAIITEKITWGARDNRKHNAQGRANLGQQMQQQPPVRKRCEFCGAVRKDNVCGYCGN
jgi:hypothetical protein